MIDLEQGFALEALRIEPLTGRVTGPGGREKLDPKVMDVLVQMAGHAGQVVLRDDLLTRLWPNVVVTDDALTRCFYELRRQLSRAGGDDRYRALIETVPKRGYRLNAAIAPMESPAAVAEAASPGARLQNRQSWWIAVGSAAALVAIAAGLYLWRSPQIADAPAAAPEPHSIAVMPFLDMSAEGNQGYLSDGVTEEILNKLSQSKNLRVISRTSSFALRNETLDVPRIAARLNVSYVLEGSLRRSGERVRITAQLIDASTNSHIWSQTYDRSLEDLFAVQDEIAASVATALQVTLAGKKPGERIPSNIQAYEHFLQGQFFYKRRSPGDIERSVSQYQQAVALDPTFARAWAALAGGYALQAFEISPPPAELRERQGEAAQKAVSLDPSLAVAHARLAQYYNLTQRRELGDRELRIAVSLDPNDLLVLGYAASDASWKGDAARAVRIMRQSVAQDPLSFVTRANYAIFLFANGELDKALTECRRALELKAGDDDGMRLVIARILVMQGRDAEARNELERISASKLRDQGLALLYRDARQSAEAEAALTRLRAGMSNPSDSVQIADAYAWRGMNDEAFQWLQDKRIEFENAAAADSVLRWSFQRELRLSPFLKPLHADPRWTALTEMPG